MTIVRSNRAVSTFFYPIITFIKKNMSYQLTLEKAGAKVLGILYTGSYQGSWGAVESYFWTDFQIMENAKPDGPKKSTSVRALIFGR